ncbi:uncharacterized domain 1-containing protein [Amycolatopsis arida]|uniref:Medium/long-chain acyl-CoA thioesterase YigI n=1 Tax=Amycolatopsis arida TaxID=587909 RepID=A0A1I5QF66_9PSEU|nr:PaaI family thioesterase [Amycolatopsis arida]TDX98819.1 uncharacterized protein (TIGR00369 family) [Amycolatopsis arida]SFP44915.1 uncharacterized domain 1-containing protein [Amycolatopsis arida]
MELSLDLARQVLAAQPFSVLLGTRLAAFTAGSVALELDVRDELLQQNGFLHGGVLGYAADNALTFAGGSVLGPAVLTGGFSINYLRPARGRALRAEASVVHASRRQAVCRCDLTMLDGDADAALCAVAQGTIVSTSRSAG